MQKERKDSDFRVFVSQRGTRCSCRVIYRGMPIYVVVAENATATALADAAYKVIKQVENNLPCEAFNFVETIDATYEARSKMKETEDGNG